MLWNAVCFAALAGNNARLLVDRLVVPDVDLSAVQVATALGDVALLVVGVVWESR